MAAFMKHVQKGRRFLNTGKSLQNSLLRESLHTCCGRNLRKTLSSIRPNTSLCVVPGKCIDSSFGRHTYALCRVAGVRWNSSSGEAASSVMPKEIPEGYIPDLPPLPTPAVPEAVDLNALGEATLSSLGLCNYTPAGFVQTALETLHVAADLPWWGAIVAGTIVVRLCVFPLVILSQRNAAKMHNHMPTIQRLQERFTKVRMEGNPLEAARAGHELMDYSKRNGISPARSMLVPMAQMPIFVSVFVGLRQMANLPVESMTTGGLLWFVDLTVPDPIYLMPILTMTTLLITIELGVDGMKAGQMGHTMKWVFRAMPIFITPFMINFPAAMLCYWFTSNVFSLGQVLFLKIPQVREFFSIPVMIKHDMSKQPKKKKFVEGFKETWSNSKLMAQVEDRQRADAARFKEAGTGPLVKTYSYDPTKGKKKIASKGKNT